MFNSYGNFGEFGAGATEVLHARPATLDPRIVAIQGRNTAVSPALAQQQAQGQGYAVPAPQAEADLHPDDIPPGAVPLLQAGVATPGAGAPTWVWVLSALALTGAVGYFVYSRSKK